jgi:hypothetical protein
MHPHSLPIDVTGVTAITILLASGTLGLTAVLIGPAKPNPGIRQSSKHLFTRMATVAPF